MDKELKPCPFCGNNQIWEKPINSTNIDGLEYYCIKCGTVAPASMWNKRILKKTKSAWKMFRRLFASNLKGLITVICKNCAFDKECKEPGKYRVLADCLMTDNEQTAIKIMQGVKKD